MERSPEAFAALVEELGLAWRHIEGQFEKNRTMTQRIGQGPADEHAWAALGYTIHNFYNALENYFLRISKFFENNLDPSSWQRDLVDRMTFSIEGVRPALLPPDLRHPVHELRSFRHVFRSIYDSALDPERVSRVNRTVPGVMEVLSRSHRRFLEDMRRIADAL